MVALACTPHSQPLWGMGADLKSNEALRELVHATKLFAVIILIKKMLTFRRGVFMIFVSHARSLERRDKLSHGFSLASRSRHHAHAYRLRLLHPNSIVS